MASGIFVLFSLVGTAQAASVTLNASGGDGRIDLAWTVGGDLVGVQVYRDTDADPAGRSRIAILPGSARSYTDRAVVNGTRYWYWIKYTDAGRNVGNSNAGSAMPTATAPAPTPTPNTGNSGASCASPAAATLPLVLNGAGEFCRVTTGSISSINSWNTDRVEINGVAYTNKWSNQLPAKINGGYTIHYVGKYPWSHLEVNGSGGSSNDPGNNPANYTLTLGVSGNGSTSLSTGSHSYQAGTAVTITATPGQGSVFSGWSGAYTGNTNPLTLSMDGNKSLTARFSTQDSGSNPAKGAFGFGKSVTGGAGGETVRVSTPDQLRYELCRNTSGGYCSDNTLRTIEVATTIDFTNSEGSAQGQGCYATQICTPAKTEATLKYSASDTHCDGKTLFDITYKKAATRGLLVGSNKTLVGVGRSGIIKGKGLLLMGGVSNIIIRNLSFTDIAQGLVFGGDGITVSDASRVWIDHNYFARIGRQMIVTGTGDQTGQVTDMTVSWNEFDGRNDYSPYCNGKHYWMLLFYGKGNFTFANNWLHDFSGRAPKIDSVANVQVVNNLFENGAGHALDSGSNVRVLVEGNDFENVTTPVTNTSSHVYALRAASSASACQSALGRSCVANWVNPAATKDNFGQDTTVLDAMRSVMPAIVTPAVPDGIRTSVMAGAGVGKM